MIPPPTQSQHLYLGLDMGGFSSLEQRVVGPQKSLLLLYTPLSSSQLTLVPLLKLSSGLLNLDAISRGRLLQVHILSVWALSEAVLLCAGHFSVDQTHAQGSPGMLSTCPPITAYKDLCDGQRQHQPHYHPDT